MLVPFLFKKKKKNLYVSMAEKGWRVKHLSIVPML